MIQTLARAAQAHPGTTTNEANDPPTLALSPLRGAGELANPMVAAPVCARAAQYRKTRRTALLLLLAGGMAGCKTAPPATPGNPAIPVVTIEADQVKAHASPILYGLMTEEINYSYEGGLYAELVNNRTFKDRQNPLSHWKLAESGGAGNSMSVVSDQPLNDVLTNSLKLEAVSATQEKPVGIANEGFWGIPVRPNTTYHASFYARAANGFTGPLTVAIVSTNRSATVFRSAQVSGLGASWKKFEVTLTTGKVPVSKDNQLVISTASPGTIFFNLVSLFPPTYNNRPNGNRPDIMQLLADMHPSFLRFPGGNYLEGNTVATRFNWKETIHDISKRPGHQDDGWNYWSSDGMGLLEFLEWCEDLKMEPVLAVYAGYSMRSGHIATGPDLEPFVKDALDEIEYVSGDASTTWGAQRAADGHPAPFKLEYVEVGNEDNFDRNAGNYDGRFAQFYDAIKAKYPKLEIIATTRVNGRTPDLVDNHLYVSAGELAMENHFNDYDNRPRTGPKVFEGEWATQTAPRTATPRMADALGDAAFLLGLERNSDLVLIESYAPLFVNVSSVRSGRGAGGSMQWPTDLIGYDALGSYGSPSYYVQKMFSLNHGDEILPTTIQNVPTREWVQTGGGGRGGPAAAPRTNQLATVYVDATRDSKTKAIYLKVVNSASTPQEVRVVIGGVSGIGPAGTATVLSAASPDDTNTINNPKKVVPVTAKVRGLGKSFTRAFPAYSITVLQLQGI
ncbi:MAG: alpha-L-arabinofuranosidase C-terminal domain-containing protein [Verrucomicrobiota bacterium]